jgi:hypothetical protein
MESRSAGGFEPSERRQRFPSDQDRDDLVGTRTGTSFDLSSDPPCAPSLGGRAEVSMKGVIGPPHGVDGGIVPWRGHRDRAFLYRGRLRRRTSGDWRNYRASVVWRLRSTACAPHRQQVAEDWTEIVGAISLGQRPFATRKRDHPRFAPPPQIENVPVPLPVVGSPDRPMGGALRQGLRPGQVARRA